MNSKHLLKLNNGSTNLEFDLSLLVIMIEQMDIMAVDILPCKQQQMSHRKDMEILTKSRNPSQKNCMSYLTQKGRVLGTHSALNRYYDPMCFSATGVVASPGSNTFHVARAARTRLTRCWISSCSFGTLASLARLPISEVVVRSRTKFGEIVNESTGVADVVDGGRTLIEDLNCDKDIVREMGNLAKEAVG